MALNRAVGILQAQLSLGQSACKLDILAVAASECPVCGAFMPAAKTAPRHVQTMAFGQIAVMEQHRWCPNGCKDANMQLVHNRSGALSLLVKPGCNIGYDVECYIGRRMFIENKQATEVHDELLERGLKISLSEVSHLAVRFLDHLEGVHLDSAGRLRGEMMKTGGYVAHIDATCDKGRGCTFVVLSGWDGWALISGRVETEHYESITPFLQQAIDTFGTPVGFVRDLGKAMRKAIATVNFHADERPPERACHFHFGKDVGKDILYDSHETLLSLFRKAELRKKLQDFIKTLSGLLIGRPFRKMVVAWAESGDAGIPAGDEGLAVVRSFAQRILDYGHDESLKKFPFSRPYLELYDRCCSICAMLSRELAPGSHAGVTMKYISRLSAILSPIVDSAAFALAAVIVREKALVFDRLRSVLRLDSEDGCISKAGEIEGDGVDLLCMERDLNGLVKELKEGLDSPSNGCIRVASEIILAHIEEHGEYLWGHKTIMTTAAGETVVRYIYRTNNILECFFRPVKRNIRRRGGCGDVGYSLEHTKASICYVGNLKSQRYIDVVYDGSLDNLPERFALYDTMNSAKAEVMNAPIASRGSLPASDKRIVRNQGYIDKVAVAIE